MKRVLESITSCCRFFWDHQFYDLCLKIGAHGFILLELLGKLCSCSWVVCSTPPLHHGCCRTSSCPCQREALNPRHKTRELGVERVENLSNRVELTDFGIESRQVQNQLWKFSIESLFFNVKSRFKFLFFGILWWFLKVDLSTCKGAIKNHQNWPKNEEKICIFHLLY